MSWPTIRRAAAEYGWLLSLVVSLLTVVAVVGVFRSAPDAASTLGVDTGPNVIAREAGSRFPTALFACDPTAIVGAPIPMVDAPLGGVRYIVTRGTESLNWPDSPEGQAPGARHYWHNSDPNYISPETGRKAAIGELVSEDAEITKPAAECIKAKGGKR